MENSGKTIGCVSIDVELHEKDLNQITNFNLVFVFSRAMIYARRGICGNRVRRSC